MPEIGEAPAEKFLLSRGLQVERFDNLGEHGKKTPDFKVFSPEGLFFYCEVKSVTSKNFDNVLKTTTSTDRLVSDIGHATKQFRAVNSSHLVPNVLVWKSIDPRYNSIKLYDVLSGKVMLEERTLADLTKLRARNRKNIESELKTIDLHIWLYDWGDPDYIFTPSQPKFLNDLQKALKIDIAEFEPIS
jgi:hypothetical protein